MTEGALRLAGIRKFQRSQGVEVSLVVREFSCESNGGKILSEFLNPPTLSEADPPTLNSFQRTPAGAAHYFHIKPRDTGAIPLQFNMHHVSLSYGSYLSLHL